MDRYWIIEENDLITEMVLGWAPPLPGQISTYVHTARLMVRIQ